MLAFQVLAARDEDQRPFHGFVVLSRAGRPQGLDQELGVRQVRAIVLAAVAGAAVVGARLVDALGLRPLFRLEKLLRAGDEFGVAAVAVGLGKAHQPQRRLVIAIAALGQRDRAVGLHEPLQVRQALGRGRIVGRAALAQDRSGYHGGHARAGLPIERAVRRLGLVQQEVNRPIHRLGVGCGVAGRRHGLLGGANAGDDHRRRQDRRQAKPLQRKKVPNHFYCS